MWTFLIPFAVAAFSLVGMIAQRCRAACLAAAREATAAAQEQERARQQAERRRAAEEKSAQAARLKEAQAAQRKAAQEQKRQQREARQAAAHAARVARAAELAELAERRLNAEKELAALRLQAAQKPAEPVEEPQPERRETIPAEATAAPVQLSFDDFAALVAARQTQEPEPQAPAQAAPQVCAVTASAQVDASEYQYFGTVEMALDLSTFAPDAAFLLERFPALAYYTARPHLLPADRIIDVYCSRPGDKLPRAHYTVPASTLYAAR